MWARWLIILLIACTACQSGLIPCPKVKSDKIKRTSVNKRIRYAERNTTASAREEQQQSKRPRSLQSYSRTADLKPALEHVDVEEWDCPKPGTKRSMPKSVKDNIKKNKRAYEAYYRTRNAADSLSH